MQKNHFAENLIKGRIAETVFELMFREATVFDIYPLGYEHTIPILRQVRDDAVKTRGERVSQVMDNLSNTPDFLLLLPDKTQAYLVEVKYRREAKQSELVRIARKISKRWEPATLFLATPQGFFFDSCQGVLNSGTLQPLSERLIPTARVSMGTAGNFGSGATGGGGSARRLTNTGKFRQSMRRARKGLRL